ncbi:hypothetical protein [Devosia sp. CAU 1758]
MTTPTVDDVFRDYNTPSVPSSGDHTPKKSEIRRLLKSILGGTAAIGDFEGAWDVGTTYVTSAYVEHGGSLWLALRETVGDTPTEGADWTLLLPGVSVADGAVSHVKLSPDVQERLGATFDTLALAQAYQPLVAPTAIRLRGFYAAGDGGGALYKLAASEPSHAGKFSITLSDGITVAWFDFAEERAHVRQFGAIGNNVEANAAVDRAGIANACAWSTAKGVTISGLVGSGRGHAPEVHLGIGRYYVDVGDIPLGPYATIIGEGAIIRPAAGFSDSNIFISDGPSWRQRFVGFQTMDTPRAFYLNSNNQNRGEVLFENCKFYNHTTEAIYLDEQSTTTVFDNCHWHENLHMLRITRGDVVIIRGGWVTGQVFDTARDAAIVSIHEWSRLRLEDVAFIPKAQTVNSTAWVRLENGASMRAIGCRFGGENGGHAVVNNYSSADLTGTIDPCYVDIQDCDISAADTDRGAIRLYAIPNQILFKGNKGLPAGRYITWGSTLDGTAQQALIDAITEVHINQGYVRIAIEDNVTEFGVESAVELRVVPVNLQRLIYTSHMSGIRITDGLSGNVLITAGSGSPEGVISAKTGSMYLRINGTAGSMIYSKTSGTGNTGWTAVA